MRTSLTQHISALCEKFLTRIKFTTPLWRKTNRTHFDQFQNSIDIALRILNDNKRLSGGRVRLASSHSLEIAVSILFVRALRKMKATKCLCWEGLSDDAAELARGMIEILFNLLLITKSGNPEKQAELYLNYFHIVREKLIKTLRKYPVFLGPIDAKKAEIAEQIKTSAELHRKDYPKKDDWSGMTIKDKAKELRMEKLYDILYSRFSEISHGNIGGLARTIREKNGKGYVSITEPVEDVRMILTESAKPFFIILYEYYKIMGCNEDEELEGIAKKLRENEDYKDSKCL